MNNVRPIKDIIYSERPKTTEEHHKEFRDKVILLTLATILAVVSFYIALKI